MKKMLRVITTAAIAGLGLTMLADPAEAKGGAIGGTGSQYLLNDAFTGNANRELAYGEQDDEVYWGDWDGNGTDTPTIRRGNTFYIRNTNVGSGSAGGMITYGDPGDVVLAGDWNGDGVDTLAVRRGNTFYVKNSISTGVADAVITYGNPGDAVLVGDWNGDHTDTLAVRRGNTYFVKNSISTGVADSVFVYGDPGDTVLVGHWAISLSGDSLMVRRGNTFYVRNSLSSGPADNVFQYGNPSDTAFVGDWDGNGVDTMGVRRPLDPGDARDCKDFPDKGAAQAYFDYYFPYYGDVARLDSDNDGEACESYFG